MRRKLLATVAVAALCTSCAPRPLGYEEPLADQQSTREAVIAETKPENIDAAPACMNLASSLSLRDQIGQLLMVGVQLEGLNGETADAIRDSHAGSAVLLGSRPPRREKLIALNSKISGLASTKVPILVAADQEGGEVQRLRGAEFSEIPNARDQGKMNPNALRVQSEKWADELRAVGIRYNLAPVADVVAHSELEKNEPIGKLGRNYGTDPKEVAKPVATFVSGMEYRQVATALKHFPGLGRVAKNTDFSQALDEVTNDNDPNWQPFKAGIAAGASSVMISSATYKNLDPKHQAVFSKHIITDILRGQLGFNKVVVSDDLGSAEAVRDTKPGQRAVLFIQAGGDLIILADPKLAKPMAETLLEAAKDPKTATMIATSAARVLELKQSAGLVRCQ